MADIRCSRILSSGCSTATFTLPSAFQASANGSKAHWRRVARMIRAPGKRRFMSSTGLVSITMMIEDIIGLDISLPRKTVNWVMPSLEAMGIEHLSLKRNMITILSNKTDRGWEIRLESEKLYYFTIEILDEQKKKTLPIPSGKCSMLIDKL